MRARLILVVPAFPKLSETFIVSKATGLLEAGWDVHVTCQRSDRKEWRHFPGGVAAALEGRVHVAWPTERHILAAALAPAAAGLCLLNNPRATGRVLLRKSLKPGWRVLSRLYLDSALIRLSPDLLHFEFGTLAVGKTYLKEVLGCRMSVSFRGFDLNFVGLESPDYYAEVFRDVDLIHCLGKDLWRRAIQRGCPADKEHVLIPPAIDTAFFDPGERQTACTVGTPERPLRILSVGRLVWQKGYEYALEAVRMLRGAGIFVEYRIVGDGDYSGAVAFARHEMGLDDSVTFLGPLSPAAVKREMAWADLFLHAAVSEGFCNAVIEAQAMALPIVCADASGLAENVADGVTGLVAPRREPEALAQAMSRLAADPSLRERMGRAGRGRAIELFSIGDQIEAFDRAFARLLSA